MVQNDLMFLAKMARSAPLCAFFLHFICTIQKKAVPLQTKTKWRNGFCP